MSTDVLYLAERLGGVVGGDIAPLTNLACLAAAGAPVRVCTRSAGARLDLYESTASLPVLELPRYPLYPLWLDRSLPRGLVQWLRSELDDRPRRRRLKRIFPDWLIAAVPAADAIVRDFGLRGRRTLFMNHGCVSCYTDALTHPWPDLEATVRMMAGYDVLSFLTDSCRREWLAFPALRDKRAVVIPEAIDEPSVLRLRSADRAELRRRLGMTEDRFHLVCMASIQQRKGQDYLLEQAGRLQEAVPQLQVWLVGPVAEAQGGREIVAEIRRRQQSLFRLVGPSDTPLAFIRAADALILPSHAEAFGMPLVEAMALRTPAIAAKRDGMREVLDEGRAGWLFEHGDPDQLPSLLQRIVRGEGRGAMLDHAEQRYRTVYAWEANVDRWRRLIRDEEG